MVDRADTYLARDAFARLGGLAIVEGRRGNARRSALLLGGAEAMRKASEGRVYHYYLPDDALRERTRPW